MAATVPYCGPNHDPSKFLIRAEPKNAKVFVLVDSRSNKPSGELAEVEKRPRGRPLQRSCACWGRGCFPCSSIVRSEMKDIYPGQRQLTRALRLLAFTLGLGMTMRVEFSGETGSGLRSTLLSQQLPKDSVRLAWEPLTSGSHRLLSCASSDPEPQADFASLPSGPKQKSCDEDASFVAQAVS